MMNSKQVRVCLIVLLASFWINTASFAQALQALSQWHFNEYSGAVASDSAGVNDGVLSGDASFVPGGVVGNAVSMTRAGQGYVNMGDVLPMTSGDFSVVVWIKTNPGDQQVEYFPVAKHDAGRTNGYLFGINPFSAYGETDKAWFYTSADVGSEAISTTSVNDGAWHQLVGVYKSSGQAEIFVDGGDAEATRAVPPIVDNIAPFMAGGLLWANTPAGRFTGQLDELQMFDYALSSGEIQFLFENPGHPLILTDGFESGDTSAWSSTQ